MPLHLFAPPTPSPSPVSDLIFPSVTWPAELIPVARTWASHRYAAIMAATDKIARQIRLGQSEDFDLANYDTTRVGRAFVHPHRCPPSVSTSPPSHRAYPAPNKRPRRRRCTLSDMHMAALTCCLWWYGKPQPRHSPTRSEGTLLSPSPSLLPSPSLPFPSLPFLLSCP